MSQASVVKLNEDYEVSDDLTHDLQNNTNMNFNGFPFHLLLILVRVAHPQIDFFPKYNNIPKVNLDWVWQEKISQVSQLHQNYSELINFPFYKKHVACY